VDGAEGRRPCTPFFSFHITVFLHAFIDQGDGDDSQTQVSLG